MQGNGFATIIGHGEPDCIASAFFRQTLTGLRVSQVAGFKFSVGERLMLMS
jgi:hypothetical protein